MWGTHRKGPAMTTLPGQKSKVYGRIEVPATELSAEKVRGYLRGVNPALLEGCETAEDLLRAAYRAGVGHRIPHNLTGHGQPSSDQNGDGYAQSAPAPMPLAGTAERDGSHL
jgi:hypothetical protein